MHIVIEIGVGLVPLNEAADRGAPLAGRETEVFARRHVAIWHLHVNINESREAAQQRDLAKYS